MPSGGSEVIGAYFPGGGVLRSCAVPRSGWSLLEGVLDFLAGLLEVAFGLLGAAFGLQAGVAGGLANVLFDLALGFGHLVGCLVLSAHDGILSVVIRPAAR